jgi:hypothetical protein
MIVATDEVNKLILEIEKVIRPHQAPTVALACMTVGLAAAMSVGMNKPQARRELLMMLDYAIHNSVGADSVKFPTGGMNGN